MKFPVLTGNEVMIPHDLNSQWNLETQRDLSPVTDNVSGNSFAGIKS